MSSQLDGSKGAQTVALQRHRLLLKRRTGDVQMGWAKPPVQGKVLQLGPGQGAVQCRVDQHHGGPDGGGSRANGEFGATLPAQQPGQPVCVGRDKVGIAKLQQLPLARHLLNRQQIGPAQYGQIVQRGQDATGHIDHGLVAPVPAPQRTGGQSVHQGPDPGGQHQLGLQGETRSVGRPVDRHTVAPWLRRSPDRRRNRAVGIVQKRAVNEHDRGSARLDATATGAGAKRTVLRNGQQGAGRGIGAPSRHRAVLTVADILDPEGGCVAGNHHQIARFECQLRWWQHGGQRLATGPGLAQHGLGDGPRLVIRHDHRQRLLLCPGAGRAGADCLVTGGQVIQRRLGP